MSQRFRVAITDYLDSTDIETTVLGELANVEALQALHESDVVSKASTVDALLVFHEVRLTAASLSQLSRCQVIVRCGVGYDNVDLAAAGEQGIVVCNVPDYGTEEVADHALMMMLAIVRRLLPCHHEIVAGGWDPTLAFGAPRLRDRVIGLIGCGRIGTAMALRAKALGMRVIFYDPYLPRGQEKALGVERVDRLEDLLPQCHVLSLHCPLTTETKQIVNARTLGLLRQGAYLVNTARGGCVDLASLHTALEEGHVEAAALDVTETEPLSHEGIRKHPKVLLTPHVAYYSLEGLREMRTKASQEVARALRGEPVWNAVNASLIKNPRCRLPSD